MLRPCVAIFQASFIVGMLGWMQACLAPLVLFVGGAGQLWGWVLVLEETQSAL